MKVLVTGAKGMLGQDLCPTLQDSGYEVIETDRNTLDICNFDMVQDFLTKEKPEIVFHCAAYTNVDKAEEDIKTAELINIKGTENVAKVCAKTGATMIYISTDYVFDGEKKEPYLPDDKPNPINEYGRTKFEGEKAVQKYCEKYYIVRTSWLYGIHGKNFVETMLSLSDKPELKVVDDQIGCPTWTIELADGILKILDKSYGIYHISGDGKTSWYNFACEIFKKEELKVNINPCTSKEFPRPAKRPKNSVLENFEDTGKLTRNWKKALADYLALRKV